MDENTQPPQVPASQEMQWKVAFHLCPLVGLLVPFGNLIAPLVLWLIKRPESTELDQVGKDVLNFQISISIYALVAAVLTLVFIGFLLFVAIFILWLYGMVMAAVKAGNNQPFRYPLTITFLR